MIYCMYLCTFLPLFHLQHLCCAYMTAQVTIFISYYEIMVRIDSGNVQNANILTVKPHLTQIILFSIRSTVHNNSSSDINVASICFSSLTDTHAAFLLLLRLLQGWEHNRDSEQGELTLSQAATCSQHNAATQDNTQRNAAVSVSICC